MQYRLLYQLSWTHAASLRKNLLCDSRLSRYSLLISKRLWDHVSYLARFQVTSTCVIFTHFQISHVTYHVIFFDSPIKSRDVSHDRSRCLTPNTRLSSLKHRHNYHIRTTSSLGNTLVRKLQNQDDWKTRWPDRDRKWRTQWMWWMWQTQWVQWMWWMQGAWRTWQIWWTWQTCWMWQSSPGVPGDLGKDHRSMCSHIASKKYKVFLTKIGAIWFIWQSIIHHQITTIFVRMLGFQWCYPIILW